MANEDFEGQDKYKYLIPIVYVMSWTSMIVGPWMFPVVYGQYCMCIVIYLAFRSLILCGQNAQLVINSHNVLKDAKNTNDQGSLQLGHSAMCVYHAFVIPNFNQPLQLLIDTLQVLSRHKNAQSLYIVFLAMENHQKNVEQKSTKLIQKFNGKFFHIASTIHELVPNQQKGKASNVNWCVQAIESTFGKLMIHEENVMITVIDSDSWVPSIYVQQIEKHLFAHFQDRHTVIYQPPQIYTRNNMTASVFIRTYDDMYSSMHAASLVSPCGVTFSLSNYTLSYILAKRVGFWDTVQEAIGEDMHMCLKVLFKTHGEVKTVPIFAPFNQLNIQTGKGTFADIRQKFWQVERHARGVADIGYCLNMLSKHKWTFKTVWMTVSLMETFFLPIVAPWPLFVTFAQFILSKIDQKFISTSPQLDQLLFIIGIANTGTFVANLIYQIFKRQSASRIYSMPNPHIIRVLQCSVLSSINLLFMTVPAFVIGSWGNLFANRQYTVSKKLSSFERSFQ